MNDRLLNALSCSDGPTSGFILRPPFDMHCPEIGDYYQSSCRVRQRPGYSCHMTRCKSRVEVPDAWRTDPAACKCGRAAMPDYLMERRKLADPTCPLCWIPIRDERERQRVQEAKMKRAAAGVGRAVERERAAKEKKEQRMAERRAQLLAELAELEGV